ncbi:PRD domain-containing protein [Erwinia sp. S43]|uniref:BglG family transcription antiterminator LicT n=1 Tax=unclassified Erwinia TaxID=2622719 RepID=UPI00190B58B5|nr:MULTISPECIES: PRD domain-containing protein [unclassified Erwinia]MBK0002193.1 PRD domain-containing protein [Erwinia sp. S38]MBK0033596.1 PRD domain-containing protein [Erwinia sp. S43]
MTVVKVLNNSLVLASTPGQEDVIVMGKGLGFSSRPGDDLDPQKIEKIYAVQNSQAARDYLRVIENSPEYLPPLVQSLIDQANVGLNGRLSEQLFFTLMDHLSFAIERFHKGIAIQNRLLFEVKRFYPREFALAQQAVNTLNQRLSITLPEEEAGNIAFHLVNGQTDVLNMESTLLSVKMLKDIFNIIKYHFRVEIDRDSLNYQRFLTHLQFFIQRMIERRQIATKDDFIFEQVRGEYPDHYRASQLIAEYVLNLLQVTLTSDELLYLMIHLVRVVPPAGELADD